MKNALLISVLFFLISCGDSSQTNKINNSNSKGSNSLEKNKISYVIVGRYCGECGGECATMYKFDNTSDKLYVDHSDSYWISKSGAKMIFKNVIEEKEKKTLMKQIIDSIPTHFFTTENSTERFGCPDCTDGCGIYFEMKTDTTVRQFYIDYQTEQLKGAVKRFGEQLKKDIMLLNQNQQGVIAYLIL